MFWQLINPNIKTFFVEFIGGSPVPQISFLFWIFVYLGIIMSIAIHEFAHAWSAHKLGDDTAFNENRMNINPLNHFDMLGFSLLLFTFIGYGKPVPINPYNFIDPKKGIMIVSLAGPISNLAIAIILGLIYTVFKPFVNFEGNFNSIMGVISGLIITLFYSLPQIGIVNIIIMIFNLLPFVPLDGSKIWGHFHYNIQDLLDEYVFPYSTFFIILCILPLFGGLSLLQILSFPFIWVYIRVFGIYI